MKFLSKENTIILLTALFVGAIVIIGYNLTNKFDPSSTDQKARGKYQLVGQPYHSWGKIDIFGGNVEKVFELENVGDGALELSKFATSCMCTEVLVEINGEKSPVFGMHTSSGWKGQLQPGEKASLIVSFDPLAHGPNATGPVTRLVSFSTNDKSNSYVELRVSGNVVK